MRGDVRPGRLDKDGRFDHQELDNKPFGKQLISSRGADCVEPLGPLTRAPTGRPKESHPTEPGRPSLSAVAPIIRLMRAQRHRTPSISTECLWVVGQQRPRAWRVAWACRYMYCSLSSRNFSLCPECVFFALCSFVGL